MPSNLPTFTIRAEQEIIDKIRYIAEYEGNSGSTEIVNLIIKRIDEFEKNVEKIDVEEVKKHLR